MKWNAVPLVGAVGLAPLVAAVPRGVVIARQQSGTPSSGMSSSMGMSASMSAPPTRSHPSSVAHTPFSGTPYTTGAVTASSVGTGIPMGSVSPEATTYPSNGNLNNPEPAPYVPAGGLGTNGTIPVYNAKSDFDYESLALALYQEWIELDLFQDGLRRFSAADFQAAGLSKADRDLIAFMAEQEVGHATLISNMLGAEAPQQCNYNYPYTNVAEYLDFCQKLTRWGESGVYGFLAHLDSREAASLLTLSITTEARQQMIFRQFQGLFPMPVWFEVGIPQSWAWTLLAPYISSCPEGQTRLAWQNFPGLQVLNQPSSATANNGTTPMNNTLGPAANVVRGNKTNNQPATGQNDGARVTHDTGALSYPGRQVYLEWQQPGQEIGPNNSYVTSTSAGAGQYVVWVSQLNVTYSPLTVTEQGTSNGTGRGYTVQPDLETFQGDPAINGTIFIAITDSDAVYTPFNLSQINPHVVAGPAIYQAG
ncbi:Protein rds1 [Penicillium diatomitis]|uniref:Protein rds1 n=1 Tax=Penicillium diatomitis TaxID=2819901 RepID=A0A9W9XCS2_9EURO|nr:Protein rds1 [Penicillium diatomitis]KAJ5489024.1 Protein rds1 [Penicillium diatomitis]